MEIFVQLDLFLSLLYVRFEEFDLNVGLVPNGYDIYNAAVKISPNIAYFLPRHTKVEQVWTFYYFSFQTYLYDSQIKS